MMLGHENPPTRKACERSWRTFSTIFTDDMNSLFMMINVFIIPDSSSNTCQLKHGDFLPIQHLKDQKYPIDSIKLKTFSCFARNIEAFGWRRERKL